MYYQYKEKDGSRFSERVFPQLVKPEYGGFIVDAYEGIDQVTICSTMFADGDEREGVIFLLYRVDTDTYLEIRHHYGKGLSIPFETARWYTEEEIEDIARIYKILHLIESVNTYKKYLLSEAFAIKNSDDKDLYSILLEHIKTIDEECDFLFCRVNEIWGNGLGVDVKDTDILLLDDGILNL